MNSITNPRRVELSTVTHTRITSKHRVAKPTNP